MATKELTKKEAAKQETALSPFVIFQTDLAEIREAVQTNVGEAGLSSSDFERIKVPSGGGTAWSVQGLDGEEMLKELSGIIIAWRDTRAYWSMSMEEAEGTMPPDCYSMDARTGTGKPAGRKLVEGDTRKVGARKLAAQIAAEPKASRGLPTCPAHLKGRAREAWNFWREELTAMSLDRRPDAQMLEGACVAYEAAVSSYETIQQQGRLIAKRAKDPKTGQLVVTDVRPHPAVAMGNDAWVLMRSFCSEFGLSPVSRTRLSIEREDSSEDDLMRILMQPRAPKGDKGFVQ